jgi:hypothetical protein
MFNLITKTDIARARKSFSDGLSAYTQTNCQCSITSDGLYRIYRPANKTVANDGNSMWGGLVLKPMDLDSSVFTKYHRYMIKFEVKGKTSNAVADISWNNLVGWNGGGLTPYPSDVVHNGSVFGTNFQSDNWITFYYMWTINDDIYKVCTSSYSSFVQGNTYLSYNGFKFGFNYTSTGSMGTDLYFKNFRLYDITNQIINPIIQKFGIINPSNFVEVENIDKINVSKSQEMIGNQIFED